MPCSRKDGVECQFPQFTAALITFEGREYCPMHLPLSSPRKAPFEEFRQEWVRLFEADHRDFACIAIVGAPQVALYNNVREGVFRNCDVGENVQLIHGQSADWSNSRFHGPTIIGPARTFTCKEAIFESSVEFHCSGSEVSVDLTGSIFRGRCRLSGLHALTSLRLDNCQFKAAPTIDNSSRIPQQTTCDGVRFILTATDEGKFRTIRTFLMTIERASWKGYFTRLKSGVIVSGRVGYEPGYLGQSRGSMM
jgi:hypothetical protein